MKNFYTLGNHINNMKIFFKQQYPPSEYNPDDEYKRIELEDLKEKSNKKIFIVIGLIIIFVISVFFVFSKPSKIQPNQTTNQTICGNRICEIGENCFNCAPDCKCNEGEYCSQEKQACVKPICGNNVCEIFESYENCCIDCGCPFDYEICNPQTKTCEAPKMNITESEALQVLLNYLQSQGKNVSESEIFGIGRCENKLCIFIRVKIEGDEWYRMFGVDEERNVNEIPLL
jgi:hypothetical protein